MKKTYSKPTTTTILLATEGSIFAESNIGFGDPVTKFSSPSRNNPFEDDWDED